MSVLRKIQRVGKKATKFQFTATYQSVVVECQKVEQWKPNQICVSWSRRGRRFITHKRPWLASPDTPLRGVVIWPEQETMEAAITLYKGPKDKSYETKEWDFNVIDVDPTGKRKILATTSVNMVRYASTMPYDHDLHLKLKPVSRKVKKVILEVSLSSVFLKEGKATDDDMMSIASMMSISNLSTIGFLEDEDDDDFMWHGGRSVTPPIMPESVLSTDELLKWTQSVTQGYRGVKITNMTTSWRTGMGFLAIVHYYRPDLIDIEAVSPNAIKENNRLAFELAQHLGISCPLTASVMISSTIPDKLLVTSFLYNMHQYFTKAMPSAIAKDSSQNGSRAQSPSSEDKPSSPFDIAKLQEFGAAMYDNLSPVGSPTRTQERAMHHYSRHGSRRSSSHTEPPTAEGLSIPATHGPYGAMTHTSSSSLGSAVEDVSQARSSRTEEVESLPQDAQGGEKGQGVGKTLDDVVVEFDTGRRGGDGGGGGGGGGDMGKQHGAGGGEVGRGEGGKGVEVPAVQISVEGNGQRQVGERAEGGEGGMRSTNEDRLLEYENLGGSDSEPRTESSVSLDEFEGGSATSLPSSSLSSGQPTPSVPVSASQTRGESHLSPREEGSGQFSSSVPSPGVTRWEDKTEQERRKSDGVQTESTSSTRTQRRLPAIPSNSLEKIDKHEERRQKAQELLRQHRISPSAKTLGASSEKGSKQLNPKKEKYRAEVRQLLEEHLGTPETNRKSLNENGSLAVSDGSTSSLPSFPILEEQEEEQPATTREGEREQLPEQEEEKVEDLNQEVQSAGVARDTEVPPSEPTTDHIKYTSAPHPRRKIGVVTRPPETISTAPVKRVLPDPKAQDTGRPLSAQGTRTVETDTPGRKRLGSEGSKPEAELRDTAPSPPRPSSSQGKPSAAQRRPRQVKAPLKVKPVSAQPSAAAMRLVQLKKDKEVAEIDGREGEGEEERGRDRKEEGTPIQNGHPPGSGAERKTNAQPLESPSTWSEHSEGLVQDILVTQSEYVRCELSRLQQKLQQLEKRAVDIESDIRQSMSIGNKEEEESLMQEWFTLLNSKNELIKRQIELNLVEREEDLEKRQFFLNRELRPLMQIPEDQKSPQQKDREETLLRELLDLIDERDKLERRKMATSRTTATERDSFATAQAQTSKVVHQSNLERHGSKDCVIS